MDSPPPAARPRALVGWRLLALFYDLWPAAALWFALSFLFNLGYLLAGHDARESVAPFTALGWLLWAACWLVTGVYATASWRRGGQTLGMRPWRLRVRDARGGRPSWGALWRRYLVGTLSLLAGGLGFWWAWVDRDRLAWHDRASGTRAIREPGTR
ncbi:RDD family protein [Luteimonas sp. SJ-92]|uniref:RDD family protein n=1 Tax=Luteimonas salinisoli TaxID=2752307 RepID=A0A853JCQ4_9GAMM|nr:RDD family protein [Luteimonas salinisoli]NZA27056.1 RDD family protein [Luteimonas salinisoli]